MDDRTHIEAVTEIPLRSRTSPSSRILQEFMDSNLIRAKVINSTLPTDKLYHALTNAKVNYKFTRITIHYRHDAVYLERID